MAEYMCPNCGKAVFYTPPGRDKSRMGYSMTCDECYEAEEVEDALRRAQ